MDAKMDEATADEARLCTHDERELQQSRSDRTGATPSVRNARDPATKCSAQYWSVPRAQRSSFCASTSVKSS